MMTKLFFTLLLILSFLQNFAQVAINQTGAVAGAHAILDVQSQTKGVLLTRMTTAQRKAIPVNSSDAGMLVYDTERRRYYMFDGTEWNALSIDGNLETSLSTMQNPVVARGGKFGGAVAIDGDYAVVGCQTDSVNGNLFQGSVQIYKKNNGSWNYTTELTVQNISAAGHFGVSVDIDSNYLVVGAEYDENANGVQGAAYVFELVNNIWTYRTKLTEANGTYYYGCSVAIHGSTIVVGAKRSTINGKTNQGAAYVYVRNGLLWNLQVKLYANDGLASDYFGTAVDIYGDNIVVGAPGVDLNNGNLTDAGAAYIFQRSLGFWSTQKKLTNSLNSKEYFGTSVSIYEDEVAVAAPSIYGGINGYVCLYKKNGITWDPLSSFHTPTFSFSKPNTLFGQSISLHHGCLLVSSPWETVDDMEYMGACFMYKRRADGSYRLVKKVYDKAGLPNNKFGTSVAMDHTDFIIGSSELDNLWGQISFGYVD